MRVAELRNLLASLPASYDRMEVSATCANCDCESFLSGRFNAFETPDADLPAQRPGNVPKLILLPEVA